jgi:hypothetical protein
MEFGPHATWGGTNIRFPKGKEERFNQVKEELARYFSELTGKVITSTGVQTQLNWACTSQDEVDNISHARQLIMNKAAALDSGFLQQSDLPSSISGIKHTVDEEEEEEA